MKKEIILTTFHGTYNSIWNHADSFYHEMKDIHNLEYLDEWEFDSESYKRDLGKAYTKFIEEQLRKYVYDGISLSFLEMDSPRQYNYRTDYIIAELRVENEEEFSTSLKIASVKTFRKKHGDLIPGWKNEEIIITLRNAVRRRIKAFGIDAEIISMDFYGSRARGTENYDSDLDIVMEYSGSISESDFFNLLHDSEDPYEIEGVRVDINPIKAEKTGTIEEFMNRVYEYDYSVISDSLNQLYDFSDRLGYLLSDLYEPCDMLEIDAYYEIASVLDYSDYWHPTTKRARDEYEMAVNSCE
jgi:predicted nucleotidyltransferase